MHVSIAHIIWPLTLWSSGLYNATKTLYFCKMRVKIVYWWPDGELIFPEHFRSLIDRIFQFKFRHWLSGILKRKIDSDIKVLNHILLKLASDHDEQKTKPSTDHEAGLSDATSTEVWSQNSDEVLSSKAEMCKFHIVWKSEFLWLIYDSSNHVMYCDVCRKASPNITGKTEFVTGKKKFRHESLVYLISLRN